ncbi:MAG: 50S ribosomal protein L5 [Candidatus Aenigmatarchaeota archaeon]
MSEIENSKKQKIMLENPMRRIRIEKIVLNIGCGKDPKKTPEQAAEILKRITGRKVVITRTHKRSTFGVAKNRPIGAMVTIRKNADELLKRLLEAVDNKIKASSFDNFGNFAFGIKEYIMIPGVKYDHRLPMFGLDVCVTLERPGYRVKRKKLWHKIGKKHLITKEETMNWVKEKFNVEII